MSNRTIKYVVVSDSDAGYRSDIRIFDAKEAADAFADEVNDRLRLAKGKGSHAQVHQVVEYEGHQYSYVLSAPRELNGSWNISSSIHCPTNTSVPLTFARGKTGYDVINDKTGEVLGERFESLYQAQESLER